MNKTKDIIYTFLKAVLVFTALFFIIGLATNQLRANVTHAQTTPFQDIIEGFCAVEAAKSPNVFELSCINVFNEDPEYWHSFLMAESIYDGLAALQDYIDSQDYYYDVISLYILEEYDIGHADGYIDGFEEGYAHANNTVDGVEALTNGIGSFFGIFLSFFLFIGTNIQIFGLSIIQVVLLVGSLGIGIAVLKWVL